MRFQPGLVERSIDLDKVKKCRGVENEPILEKTQRVLPKDPLFKHRHVFLGINTAFLRHNL
jgi:hypothetical protein